MAGLLRGRYQVSLELILNSGSPGQGGGVGGGGKAGQAAADIGQWGTGRLCHRGVGPRVSVTVLTMESWGCLHK